MMLKIQLYITGINYILQVLCKNHFYKVFEHSCVAAVCDKNQWSTDIDFL